MINTYQMVEFALKVTIVIFITDIIIAPVKIFTEAAASVASTVATALLSEMLPHIGEKSRAVHGIIRVIVDCHNDDDVVGISA